MLFFFAFFAFCIGIICGENELFSWQSFFWLLTIFITLILSFKKFLQKFFICLSVFLIGFSLSDNSHKQRFASLEILEKVVENSQEKTTITGIITDELYQNNFRKTFRLNIDNIATTSTNYTFNQKDNIGIFVDIPKNLTLNKGDKIQFSQKIDNFFDISENSKISGFNKYPWFYKAYGKSSLFKFEKLSQDWENYIQKIRKKIKNIVSRWFPKENTALILGVTTGNTDYLTSETKAEFKNASLTHILVVSGANIAFVMLIIGFILQFFPLSKYLHYFIIFSGVFAYWILVWWDVPVIRASIMWIISYIWIRGFLKIHSLSLLVLVAWIFLLFEPLWLLYDPSFWLSFAATFGIIVFNNPIEKFLQKYIKAKFIITSISVTLAATIWSLGAVIYYFESFAILGIFANILIWGIMWILLILSSLYIAIGFFIPEIILYYLWIPIFWITEYIFMISKIFWQFSPMEISEKIKIPLSICVYFIGFLYAIHADEHKRTIDQKDYQ